LAEFLVIVIGAGMAGLNAAIQPKHAGIPYTVLEKNSGVGGTWYENRYPRARVDTHSRTYTHTVGADFVFPAECCEQSANEAYVNWLADHFDVRENIEFDTEVSSIVWDEVGNVWRLETDGPDGSRVYRANAVITAVGLLSRPNIPDIPGLANFGRHAFCLSTAVAFGAQLHLVPILLERGFSPTVAATIAGLIGATQV
jgi:4-hydroxyacetophenone monooxygenase